MNPSFLPGLLPKEEKAHRERMEWQSRNNRNPRPVPAYEGQVIGAIGGIFIALIALVIFAGGAALIVPFGVSALSGLGTHALVVLIVILLLASALVRR